MKNKFYSAAASFLASLLASAVLFSSAYPLTASETVKIEAAEYIEAEEDGENVGPSVVNTDDGDEAPASDEAPSDEGEDGGFDEGDESEPGDELETSGQCGESAEWIFRDGELTISGDGPMEDYASPDDAPWTSLAPLISSVTVSEGITRVGSYAFPYCRMTEMYLPDSVTDIGEGAFYRCYKLKSFTTESDDDLLTVGNRAFYDCYNLRSLSLPNSVVSIGEYSFTGCTSLKNLIVPRSLVSLGNYAFAGCVKVSYVVLYDSLTELGEGAFENCAALEYVELPDSLTELKSFTFLDCSSLKRISLGKSLKKIGTDVFTWCSSLSELHIPDSLESMEAFTYGFYYIDGKYYQYEDVLIVSTGGVGEEYAALHGMRHVIDESGHVCESICLYCGRCKNHDCPFEVCKDKCEGHTFPITGKCGDDLYWSLTEDGDLFLYGSGEMYDYRLEAAPWYGARRVIRSVTTGDGVTKIGESAFSDCAVLLSVSLSGTVQSLGSKSFYRCEQLESVSAPGVATVGRFAFAFCPIDVIDLPSCTVIREYAFIGCSSLVQFKLPSLREIGDGAFESCGLEFAALPESVEFIGDRALGFNMDSDRILRPVPGFTLSGSYGNGVIPAYASLHGFLFDRTDTHECSSVCTLCGGCRDLDCILPECAVKCIMRCDDWVNPYIDVAAGSWYYDHVRYVSLYGMFKGVDTDLFGPDSTLSRAMFVTVLYRAFGSPKTEFVTGFADVPSDTWYTDAVSWAAENGIVNGVAPDKFAPDDSITREQMATIMYRSATFYGEGAGVEDDIGEDPDSIAELFDRFEDAGEISEYAIPTLAWAVRSGLINGKSETTLEPTSGATRAEAAAIMRRWYSSLDL